MMWWIFIVFVSLGVDLCLVCLMILIGIVFYRMFGFGLIRISVGLICSFVSNCISKGYRLYFLLFYM